MTLQTFLVIGSPTEFLNLSNFHTVKRDLAKRDFSKLADCRIFSNLHMFLCGIYSYPPPEVCVAPLDHLCRLLRDFLSPVARPDHELFCQLVSFPLCWVFFCVDLHYVNFATVLLCPWYFGIVDFSAKVLANGLCHISAVFVFIHDGWVFPKVLLNLGAFVDWSRNILARMISVVGRLPPSWTALPPVIPPLHQVTLCPSSSPHVKLFCRLIFKVSCRIVLYCLSFSPVVSCATDYFFFIFPVVMCQLLSYSVMSPSANVSSTITTGLFYIASHPLPS